MNPVRLSPRQVWPWVLATFVVLLSPQVFLFFTAGCCGPGNPLTHLVMMLPWLSLPLLIGGLWVSAGRRK